MVTCLGDVFRPNAAMATVRVLERLGVRVHFPEEQTCCGQPFYNSGFLEGARDLARHTIQAFADDRPVVTPSGSCAAMLRLEYPHLFPDDPEWARRAEHLAARTFELSDFLVNQLMVTQVGARFEGKVAYHYACHLRGLGLKDEAETLIRNVAGVDLRPLRAQDQCCGFGGSFAVRYPQISTAMVRDKVSCIVETDADVLISTDAGCLMNIGGAMHRNELPVQTMHLAELLDSR
jgi:L-lactate dehydrogenase complex protein LldE